MGLGVSMLLILGWQGLGIVWGGDWHDDRLAAWFRAGQRLGWGWRLGPGGLLEAGPWGGHRARGGPVDVETSHPHTLLGEKSRVRLGAGGLLQ